VIDEYDLPERVEDVPALDALLATIYERYHYDFRDYARSSLHRRVRTAMLRLGVGTLGELRQRVTEEPNLFSQLLAYFTVQLSEMFRDPPYFQLFREHVVPVLRTYASRKLWVAGCSTGEEAYSFAIILREEGLLERTQIYATDIYERSLRIAESGIYDLERMRLFSENYLQAGGKGSLSEYYSTSTTGGAVFDRSLRDHIVFADHSLTTDSVFAEMHVVSCRNVLIYFTKPLQDRVFQLFKDSLIRGGYLGLGARETLDMSPVRDSFLPMAERWHKKREVRP
jgi:chemotaxis protein methyltransferase CheR